MAACGAVSRPTTRRIQQWPIRPISERSTLASSASANSMTSGLPSPSAPAVAPTSGKTLRPTTSLRRRSSLLEYIYYIIRRVVVSTLHLENIEGSTRVLFCCAPSTDHLEQCLHHIRNTVVITIGCSSMPTIKLLVDMLYLKL